MSKFQAANQRAAKARVRMAKRAKRDRFWKQNKKRILIVTMVFFLLVFLGVFTPLGPDYYRSRIDSDKMVGSRNVRAGYLKELYNLGVLYQYTMRSDKAKECFDEIAHLYFGFKLDTFAKSPNRGYDERALAEGKIKKGQSQGPPYIVDSEDIRYVGYAIWRMGEIIQFTGSKQFAYNIYQLLYLDDILANHESQTDAGVTEIVQAYCDRFMGRR